MAWLLAIYLVGAGITFHLVYIFFVKKYIKEKSALKFSFWIDQYLGAILCMTIFWVIVLPVIVMLCPILIAIKFINKHYGIEL